MFDAYGVAAPIFTNGNAFMTVEYAHHELVARSPSRCARGLKDRGYRG